MYYLILNWNLGGRGGRREGLLKRMVNYVFMRIMVEWSAEGVWITFRSCKCLFRRIYTSPKGIFGLTTDKLVARKLTNGGCYGIRIVNSAGAGRAAQNQVSDCPCLRAPGNNTLGEDWLSHSFSMVRCPVRWSETNRDGA